MLPTDVLRIVLVDTARFRGHDHFMIPRTYYQQIQRATAQFAILTIVLLGITLICAWLGFTQGVVSLRGATASAAYASGVLFILWGIASLFRMVGHRQHKP
jgi:hypothetical protein